MKPSFQTTLCGSVEIAGRGVHSNAPVRVHLRPGAVDTGLVMHRTGLPDGRSRVVEANWRKVTRTDLSTVLGDGAQDLVATTEHLMAALAGLGVDNARIEVDGPEMPIMDGSALPFVRAVDAVGVIQQVKTRRHLRILKTVRIDNGQSFAELKPAMGGFRLDVEIDFENAAIGRQRRLFDVDPQAFRAQIAPARTFGFLYEVERLRAMGLAKGSSLENSVGIDGERVMNPEGLRFPDEFVRHKALDAIGDLALAGAPIIGAYRGYRPGHKVNLMVLQALFADASAYEFVEGRRVREPLPARVASGRAAYAAEANA